MLLKNNTINKIIEDRRKEDYNEGKYVGGNNMILIQNGFVIDPASKREEECDVLIEKSVVKKIEKNISIEDLPSDVEVIDATGCIVAPGLVDVHVHFRDPGFTYKEDIETGALAALKGGYTSVVLMANTKPAVDNEETLSYVIQKGKKTDLNIYTCASVTQSLAGKELVDMDTLYEKGAVGFTDDGIPIMDEKLMEEAMLTTAKLKVPISLHEENPQLITNNGVNRGKASDYFGIGGSPREAEISLIERDLEIAKKTGAILNIQHISTKEGVDLVRRAKKDPLGKNIHAEATPHHFSFTEDLTIAKKTLAKMNPPLREEADRQAILDGLKDGTIDLIATDHAPHSKEEKEKPITEAPSGIIGLETALSLGIMKLVNTNVLTMSKLLACMTCNPADLYHLECGRLQEGKTADIVVYNPAQTWTANQFVSKSSNSPLIGEELQGVVHYTITNGKIVYRK